MSRTMKLKVALAALLAVLLLLTGLFWYFRIYTKTPEYAIRSIRV